MKKLLKLMFILTMIIGLYGCGSSSSDEESNDNSIETVVKYNVVINVECKENLLFSRYDVDIYVDDILEETIDHGGSTTLNLELTEGNHKINFEKQDDSTVDGSEEFEVNQNIELSYKISCTSSQVEVEIIDDNEQIEDEKEDVIMSTITSDELISKNYKDVKQTLEDLGFTNVDTYSTETKEEDKANQVFNVYIKVDGSKQSIMNGQSYLRDSKIYIEYYKYEKPESVHYSTNDSETVKLGNQGVYAYKNSKSYENYWIIDFDKGYVYNFTEGNGDDSCLRFKIKSGTLNDSLKICYDETGNGTPWYVHFNYVNSPAKLIVNDHYNNRFEFMPTGLSTALSKMSTKKIMDA